MPVPAHLRWAKWRVITAGVASLQEVNEYYDAVDLMDACEVLDIQAEADARAYDKAGRTT